MEVDQQQATNASIQQLPEWMDNVRVSLIRDYASSRVKQNARKQVVERLKNTQIPCSQFPFLKVQLDMTLETAHHMDIKRLEEECSNFIRAKVIEKKMAEARNFGEVTWAALTEMKKAEILEAFRTSDIPQIVQNEWMLQLNQLCDHQWYHEAEKSAHNAVMKRQLPDNQKVKSKNASDLTVERRQDEKRVQKRVKVIAETANIFEILNQDQDLVEGLQTEESSQEHDNTSKEGQQEEGRQENNEIKFNISTHETSLTSNKVELKQPKTIVSTQYKTVSKLKQVMFKFFEKPRKIQQIDQSSPTPDTYPLPEKIEDKMSTRTTHAEKGAEQIRAVHTLGNIIIPQEYLNLLEKGIKYVPTIWTKDEVIHQTINDVKKQFEIIVKHHPAHKIIMNKVNSLINTKTKKLMRLRHTRISEEERITSKALKYLEDNRYIVKPADKNLGLTIMPSDWYEQEVEKHLSKTDTYQKLNSTPEWNVAKDKLIVLLTKYKRRDLIQKLVKEDHKPSEFYIIPKLHKKPVASRPIIPGHSHFTSNVSKYLVDKLQIVIDQFDWVLKNSQAFIEQVENTTILNENVCLASFDVESLYTTIDTKKAIKVIKPLLRTKYEENEATFLCSLLEWVMNNNYFQWKGKWFKQINGTAMGTSCAPQFANLYLIHFERIKFKAGLSDIWDNNNQKKLHYWRYIDDILIIEEETNIQKKFLDINKWTKDLKFTLDFGKTKQPFLDLQVYKGTRFEENRILDLKLYHKPTDLHLFTDPRSNIPNKYKFSWITGEQIRILRSSSNKQVFDESVEEFKYFLERRKYKREIWQRYLPLTYSEFNRNFMLAKKIQKRDPKIRNIYMPHTSMWREIQRIIHEVGSEIVKIYDDLDITINVITLKGKSLQEFANINNRKVLAGLTQQQVILASNEPIESQTLQDSTRFVRLKHLREGTSTSHTPGRVKKPKVS